ncbi:MAG: hypothetical protein HC861_08255, partial [Rhodospirillaceae bacterium]|nr:hypothetical protein [Rhodospirillaceae bacterium]
RKHHGDDYHYSEGYYYQPPVYYYQPAPVYVAPPPPPIYYYRRRSMCGQSSPSCFRSTSTEIPRPQVRRLREGRDRMVSPLCASVV